eukprot:Rmarinus@m.29054
MNTADINEVFPDFTVATWLASHGLERYSQEFLSNQVDTLYVILSLTEDELKETLGVAALGVRKKVRKAIESLRLDVQREMRKGRSRARPQPPVGPRPTSTAPESMARNQSQQPLPSPAKSSPPSYNINPTPQKSVVAGVAGVKSLSRPSWRPEDVGPDGSIISPALPQTAGGEVDSVVQAVVDAVVPRVVEGMSRLGPRWREDGPGAAQVATLISPSTAPGTTPGAGPTTPGGARTFPVRSSTAFQRSLLHTPGSKAMGMASDQKEAMDSDVAIIHQENLELLDQVLLGLPSAASRDAFLRSLNFQLRKKIRALQVAGESLGLGDISGVTMGGAAGEGVAEDEVGFLRGSADPRPEQLHIWRRAFAKFSESGDDVIDSANVRAVLRELCEPVSTGDLKEGLRQMDPRRTGMVAFGSFAAWLQRTRMSRHKHGNPNVSSSFQCFRAKIKKMLQGGADVKRAKLKGGKLFPSFRHIPLHVNLKVMQGEIGHMDIRTRVRIRLRPQVPATAHVTVNRLLPVSTRRYLVAHSVKGSAVRTFQDPTGIPPPWSPGTTPAVSTEGDVEAYQDDAVSMLVRVRLGVQGGRGTEQHRNLSDVNAVCKLAEQRLGVAVLRSAVEAEEGVEKLESDQEPSDELGFNLAAPPAVELVQLDAGNREVRVDDLLREAAVEVARRREAAEQKIRRKKRRARKAAKSMHRISPPQSSGDESTTVDEADINVPATGREQVVVTLSFKIDPLEEFGLDPALLHSADLSFEWYHRIDEILHEGLTGKDNISVSVPRTRIDLAKLLDGWQLNVDSRLSVDLFAWLESPAAPSWAAEWWARHRERSLVEWGNVGESSGRGLIGFLMESFRHARKQMRSDELLDSAFGREPFEGGDDSKSREVPPDGVRLNLTMKMRPLQEVFSAAASTQESLGPQGHAGGFKSVAAAATLTTPEGTEKILPASRPVVDELEEKLRSLRLWRYNSDEMSERMSKVFASVFISLPSILKRVYCDLADTLTGPTSIQIVTPHFEMEVDLLGFEGLYRFIPEVDVINEWAEYWGQLFR